MATTTVTERSLRGQDFSTYIIDEVTKGTVPTSPVLIPVRRSSGKGMKTNNYVEDPEVKALGEATEQILDSSDLTAPLESSFSKQSIDWAIKSIQSDKTQVTVTATDIAVTATGFTSVAAEFGSYVSGDVFWVTGATDTTLNTFYIIDTVTSAEIVTMTAPVATESAGASITLDTYRAKNANTPTYSVIQTVAPDDTAAGSIDYNNLESSILDSLSAEVGETGIVTASASFLAERQTTAVYAGQTYGTVLTDRSVSSNKAAQSSVVAFYVDGIDDTCGIKSLSFEIANNHSKDEASGCDAFYVRGQFAVSGSFVARARTTNSFLWRNKAWNDTRASIALRVKHGGGDESYIVFNKNAITEVTQDDGNNAVANAQCSFISEYDSTNEMTCAVYTNWA